MANLKQLHDRDFNLWIEKTKEAIQNRDFANMDWDNLLDEIDDMGKSEKRALDSYMQRLIEHILKLKYQGYFILKRDAICSRLNWHLRCA